jgi:hypothetical protein
MYTYPLNLTITSGAAEDPPRNLATQLKLDIKLTFKKNAAFCGRLEVLVTMRCQLQRWIFRATTLKAVAVAGLLNRSH